MSAIGKGLAAMLAIGICGALSMGGEKAEPKPHIPREVAAGNTAFALDLHRQLGAHPGNVFFSPSSISTALGMAASGADGRTLDELVAVLHQSKDAKTRDAGLAALSAYGSAEAPGFKLKSANALWGQPDYPFLPGYVERLRTQFRAEANGLDFRDSSGATKTINGWVERATAGKISDLFAPGSLTTGTKLVLVNAVYFLGEWQKPFDKRSTNKEPFHGDAGAKFDVDMMHKTDSYRYAETADWQCVALPYKPATVRGEMVVLLPKTGKELAKLESALAVDELDKIFNGMKAQNVALALPKLKFRTKYDLKPPLERLGVQQAFDNLKADFRHMSSGEGLYITKVVHQAFLEMNEERTEAAAATGIAFAPRGMPRKSDLPIVFRADRPFLFAIRDAETGLIFFLGRCVDPRG